jgi:hypothetical protein
VVWHGILQAPSGEHSREVSQAGRERQRQKEKAGDSMTTVTYEVHVQRDGSWWVLGIASTADKAHELASRMDGYSTLPRLTLKVTLERTVKIVGDDGRSDYKTTHSGSRLD